MAANQGMFQVKITNGSLGEAVEGAQTSLSTSDSARLSTCYPGGPQYTSTPPSLNIDGELVAEATPIQYRTLYYNACMKGMSKSPQQFDKSIDMSYGTTNDDSPSPPKLTDLTNPEVGANGDVEAAQGSEGSTIAASGRGPNINVHPIDSILDRPMADVKPNSGLNSFVISPDDSSLVMGSPLFAVPLSMPKGDSRATEGGISKNHTGQSPVE